MTGRSQFPSDLPRMLCLAYITESVCQGGHTLCFRARSRGHVRPRERPLAASRPRMINRVPTIDRGGEPLDRPFSLCRRARRQEPQEQCRGGQPRSEERNLPEVSPGWGRRIAVHRPDKTVTAARNGFNVARLIRRVIERAPELVNRRVERMLELDEGAVGPELLLQLFASDQFTRPLEQDSEDAERPVLDFNAAIAIPQLSRHQVSFKRAKANQPGGSSRSLSAICLDRWPIRHWRRHLNSPLGRHTYHLF